MKSYAPYHVSIVTRDANWCFRQSQHIVDTFDNAKDAKTLARRIACAIGTLGNYKGHTNIAFALVLYGKYQDRVHTVVRTPLAQKQFLAQRVDVLM